MATCVRIAVACGFHVSQHRKTRGRSNSPAAKRIGKPRGGNLLSAGFGVAPPLSSAGGSVKRVVFLISFPHGDRPLPLLCFGRVGCPQGRSHSRVPPAGPIFFLSRQPRGVGIDRSTRKLFRSSGGCSDVFSVATAKCCGWCLSVVVPRRANIISECPR